jgi:proteasome accessory factor C
MADGSTAAERLDRVLHILPAAAVEGGVTLERLARELDAEVATVVSDLTDVAARSYYHPAGSGDDIQIHLEADRVSVWTTGAFRRPVKLSPGEAVSLALGLRCRGLEGGPGEAGAPAGPTLLERVEAHLATAPVPDEPLQGIHAADAEPDPDGIRETLVAGARYRIPCRIRYLKPGGAMPDERVIDPYVVAHAEGRWYVIAWCEGPGEARAFRLDRILDAVGCGGSFERRPEVDVDAFLEGGRVYHSDPGIEALVRYSAAIARWIVEWAPDAEPDGDGAVRVRHRVSDPGWIVRRVLELGGEAELLQPPALREQVVREAEKVLAVGEAHTS